MITATPNTAALLTSKFQALYELFAEFSHQTTELHGTLPVNDDASRSVFNSLSRIMAFTDQINMVVSLMREDVRVIEEMSAGRVDSSWTEEIERCYYEWLRASKSAAPNVN